MAAYRERKKLVDIVRRMLDGELSFLEGALMVPRAEALEIDDFDEDFLPFVAINSESDRFPLGAVRQYWSQDALAKLHPEIDGAEKWAGQTANHYCQRIIERLGPVAVRREIGQIARSMLCGEVTFIEGAHRIAPLHDYCALPALDTDIGAVLGVHQAYLWLPPIDGREHWPLDMLQAKHPEIPHAEATAKQTLTRHCQSLIERFLGESPQTPT
ncbi:MAG: hypothetical protein FJX11_22540 [Alphaproteobacteria bacterium]|nr:hypothetical protein [Alphaproteobacteria bacterium]